MKSNFFTKSEKGNNYLVSMNKKLIIPASPLLIYFFQNKRESVLDGLPHSLCINNQTYNEKEIAHTFKKYQYLKKQGFNLQNQYGAHFSGKITAKQVKTQLANLSQLVFEVTDHCNLRCKYCGYGELYDNYDQREKKNMPFATAKTLIDYLVELWNSDLNTSIGQTVYISFYGGEPLLNMPFIKETISYIESLHIAQIRFIYSMTTNAVLLHKNMDYLIEKDFHLLISLDGNEKNHSYRVFPNGQNSFSKVIENVQLLKNKNASFFESNVNFNSVLHNRNSILESCQFINNNFGKTPSIGELNRTGIRPDKIVEFGHTFKDLYADFKQKEHYHKIMDETDWENPDFREAISFVHLHSGNIFRTYNDFFEKRSRKNYIPTGTCLPFNRKLFVTVNNKILPCERIGHEHALGFVANGKVELDFEDIARKYNGYFKKLAKQCAQCYNRNSCFQCVLCLDHLDEHPVCNGCSDQNRFQSMWKSNLSYLEEFPASYQKIMEEVIMR